MRYEARTDYTSLPGVCWNKGYCEHYGEVVEAIVTASGLVVCAECRDFNVRDVDGFPFKASDFRYAI